MFRRLFKPASTPQASSSAQAPKPADLAGMRNEYVAPGFNESELTDDPAELFQQWVTDAKCSGIIDPNAMTLATASTDGTPHARIVLLKGLSADGFAFYTNYQSDKAQDLAANPRAFTGSPGPN